MFLLLFNKVFFYFSQIKKKKDFSFDGFNVFIILNLMECKHDLAFPRYPTDLN